MTDISMIHTEDSDRALLDEILEFGNETMARCDRGDCGPRARSVMVYALTYFAAAMVADSNVPDPEAVWNGVVAQAWKEGLSALARHPERRADA